MCFRDRSHHVEDLPGPFFVHDGKVEVSAARIRGLLVRPAELSGKQAAGKRTPHEQADLFGFQQWNNFPFEIAAGDRVISLKCVESGQVPELGEAEGFGDLPCLPVGAADVADLSLLHQGVESANRLFDRGHGIIAMNLVQVDMVGLQTAETGLHTVHNVAARSPDVIPPRADAAIDLALTLRIVVRRIKEIDDAVNRRLDQFIGPSLANAADGLEDPSAVPLPSPNVMVPKQSFETRRPVLPSVAYSMAFSFHVSLLCRDDPTSARCRPCRH